MSPQLIMNQPYTSKADIWSLGVIFFELLYGFPPFGERTKFELKDIFLNKKKVEFPKSFFKVFQPNSGVSKISKKAKDFILKTLAVEEKDRIGWDDLFFHPLFDDFFKYRVNQRRVKCQNQLFRLISQINTNITSKKFTCISLFDSFDKQKKGYLSFENLCDLVKTFQNDCDREDFEFIFNIFDLNNRNKITVDDFIKTVALNSTLKVLITS